MKKECTACKQFLSAIEFNKDSRRKDGLRSYCKKCYKKDMEEKRKKENKLSFTHMV